METPLSDRDIYIVRSPTFQIALGDAFEALRKSYVPIVAQSTLLEFIKVFSRIPDVPEEEKNLLKNLQPILLTSHAYIKKGERRLLMNQLSKYKKLWVTSDEKSDQLSDTIQNLKVKEDSLIKKCFFGLIYGHSVHPQLEISLRKANAHKWYINPHGISVFGVDDEQVFWDSFAKEWKAQTDDSSLSEFRTDGVLKLISYTKTVDPTVVPYSVIQGTVLESLNHNALSVH